MAQMPGALYKPLPLSVLSGKKMAVYNRVNLHIAVSNADSLFGYFNGTGKPSSHFYVRFDGTIEQYVDTIYRAEADLEGNDATISIETAGGIDQNAPWTAAQQESLAQIYAWAVKTHGIATKLATTSRIGEESKGLSWHRLGIDPWRVAGGMKYSLSRGKRCPLDVNIPLIQNIYDRAVAILGGASGGGGGTPTPPPVVTPPPVTPPKPTKPNCTQLQRAVRTTADNAWGANTDKHCDAVREASNWGGNDFPWGKAFTQTVVGTTPDGIFGPKSWAAHDATVRAMQDALRAMGFDPGNTDGIWGDKSEGAYQAARNACHI